MVTCPNCGRENVDTVRLCSFCDHELRPSRAINCPECGKTNAPDNETCPHCGARLKAAPPSTSTGPASGWSLEGRPPPQDEGVRAGEAEEAETPSAVEASPVVAAGETVESAELATQVVEPSAEEPGKGAAGDVRDLFSDLAAAQEVPPPVEAGAEGELPDWFAGDSLEAVEEAEPEERAEAAPAEEKPDWFTDSLEATREVEPEPEEKAEAAAEVPTWLRTDAAPAEAEAPAEAASEPEPPDWLKEEPAPAAPPPEQAKVQVVSEDWLDQALKGEAGDEPPEEAEPAAPAAPDEAMPDWLAEAKQPSPTADEAELPDWLAEARTAPASPAADIDEDTPDWLTEAMTRPGGPGAAEGGDETLALEEDMPDWLKAVTLKATGSLPPLQPETEGEAGGESTLPAFEFDVPGEGEGDMPDWLRAMQPAGIDSGGAAPAPTEEPVPFEGSLFEWLEKEGASLGEALTAAGEGAEGEESPLAEPIDLSGAELPDWLRALRPAEDGTLVAEVTPAAPAGPQELPAQMEMLRAAHIPGVLDPEADAREEHVGPLKGVVGAVAAAPIFAELQSPPAARAEAAVGVDSAQVSLLQDLLSVEAEGVPGKGAAGGLPAVLGRGLAWLLLIAAVSLPVAGGVTLFEPPASVEVAAADAARSLNELGQPANVLLAFEYDPSQAGELSAEAEALITILMEREATLYAVSTQPTGPAIAQDLLESLAEEHGYVYGQDYVNLGYVSGKAAGVRGLVTGGAKGVVSPLGYDYQGMATGFGSARLSDLGVDMIVLLAGTPEATRIWVEQAGNLSGIPIVAAVGAGAEPMALPYYRQGRQLEGVVSGLAGAASLTRATHDLSLPPLLKARWNAQVAGALVAGLVVLAGAVIQGVSGSLRRQQEQA